MAKTVVGLEVTEESVRAAEVTVGRAPQLVGYGEVPLPIDAAKDSEVVDAGAVAVALRQLWTGARFKAKEVTLGVASRRILVREYTTQAMRPDLLRDALPYQVQDLLPVPASQAVLDFFPLSQQGDQISGLLVAAVSESIEHIITTLDRVKLRTRHVDLTAFGLARASAALAAPEETIAFVYVGDHTTQVVVAQGGVPHFVRILPIDMPTAAVLRKSGLPELPVVEPVAETVPAGAIRPRGALRPGGTGPAISDLAGRVRSTLAFFGSRPGTAPLTSVLVAGAGIAADGALSALTSALDIPVRVVNVGDVVTLKSELPPGELSLNLVSTVGLALGEGR
ncbi:type IV pilus biogenesis protein PilM [Microbacterium lacus]|uniref:SHS2 domain-containing protein n=1 Tax=Microbacterium lacus TaxID=415217 RepID=A0ABN2GJ05_9MICO